ncbi:MAG: hypothetical protein U0694_27250 [Anaerolineae bacterium]
MNTLSESRRQQAVQYIKQQARPLEQKVFAYYFEAGSKDAILQELSQFQNEDGGFGKALEPDLRTSHSSVLATTIAFQKFREIQAPANTPIVQQAAQYVLNTYDAAHKIWPIIPPNVDEAPHAPWWNYDNDPQRFLVNPRAEILGYFYDYPDLFPEGLREELTQEVLQHLAQQSDEIEMHDILCYIRLCEARNLPPAVQAPLLAKLKPAVMKAVVQDPLQWGNYGLTPLSVVSSPQSLFYADFAPLLPANLAYIAQSQAEEGCWSPTWSWEDSSKEGWQAAERDLRGFFTVSNLLLFRCFS